MKTIFHKIAKSGLYGAAFLVGMTACTDDHFDVITGDGTSVNTLWQNVKNTKELSDVAEIMERAMVLTSETDKGQKQSFGQLLNSSEEMTVWLPVNGSFDKQHYLDLFEEADRLREEGNTKDAMAIEYQVSSQFLSNHVARFNYSAMDYQEVRMLNGKLYAFNPVENVFNGQAISADAKMPSSNGMLYTINGVSPYSYNIYDYVKSKSQFSKLFSGIKEYDTETFNESASTPGGMNENGEMVYVDSVFVFSNEMLESNGLRHIYNEDSVYVCNFPTDACYDEVVDNVSKLFKYKNSYNYEWSRSTHGFTYSGSRAKKLTKEEIDSVTLRSTLSAILASSSVSASELVPDELRRDSAAVMNEVLTRDSIITAGYMTIYNKNMGTGEPNPFYGKTITKASNGYVCEMDEYTMDPNYSFIGRSQLPASRYMVVDLQGSTSQDPVNIDLTSANTLQTEPDENGETRDSIDLGGLVEEGRYYYFPVSGNSNLMIDFPLYGVLSAHYKISVIMLPNCTCTSNIRLDDNNQPIIENPQFDATIFDDDNKQLISRKAIPVNQKKAEKIVLWEDFEFPYTYANMPDNVQSFPRLRIALPYSYQRRGNVKALSIVGIVLEPVRE